MIMVKITVSRIMAKATGVKINIEEAVLTASFFFYRHMMNVYLFMQVRYNTYLEQDGQTVTRIDTAMNAN